MSATPFSKDTIADYNKVLKFPKDAAFQIPGTGDKKMVWVPFDSDFGFAKAEVIKENGDKRDVKLETGEVGNDIDYYFFFFSFFHIFIIFFYFF